MIIKRLALILVCTLIFFVQLSYGQLPAKPAKKVNSSVQVWTAFYHQSRLSTKWGIWFDGQFRRTDFLNRWATIILRPGVVYHLSDDARLVGGYAYARFYPGESGGDVQPEHRFWQQINWEGKLGKVATNQWVRVEERFRRKLVQNELTDGYMYNWRFRCMVSGQIPLKGDKVKPGAPGLLLQDEIWLNAGRQITYNYFDQNRLFLGLVVPFSEQLRMQIGYQHVFQQQASGYEFEDKHTLRLFVYHTLDFRKQP